LALEAARCTSGPSGLVPFDLDDSIELVLGEGLGRIDRAVVYLGETL
jgi:hypothetical protein